MISKFLPYKRDFQGKIRRMLATIHRPALAAEIAAALDRSPAAVLLGPRQVGKTTLARQFVAAGSSHYLDLEDPTVLAQLAAPMNLLAGLRGLVVIDEVQRAPELFPVLRVLLDRDDRPARFLLLGSASPALLRQTSESLAGRLAIIDIGGFDLRDLCGAPGTPDDGAGIVPRLWWRGGFPRAYLARDDGASRAWRRDFMRLVIERDLPALGLQVSLPAMLRFFAMLAHVHGQVWNAADSARALGVNESTVRRYLDHLTQVYMVRQLQPWFENLGKRQVKAPKIFFRDSGLLHEQLSIASPEALLLHPRSGASWEGFVIEQILSIAAPDQAYFWSTHAGAELDLLLFKDGRRVGVEIKRSDAPTLTASMRIALTDLKLDALYVVYPGRRRYPLADRVEAVPLTALLPPSASAGGGAGA
jgi:predicted AAA+ superfamily ATPase